MADNFWPIPINPMALGADESTLPGGAGWENANLLPIQKNRKTGQWAWGMPNSLAAALSGVMAPGKAANGLYERMIDPTTGVNYYDGMLGDVSNLAGMLTVGAGAYPKAPNTLGMGGGKIAATLDNVQVSTKDASDIFGNGTSRVKYVDQPSNGYIEVAVRPNGSASVIGLEVPEQFRGKGIGQALQGRVMQDFPMMQGQVSSKAAATTAYRLGRRPVGKPTATLDEIFKMIDDDSSVNLVSPDMQQLIVRMRGN